MFEVTYFYHERKPDGGYNTDEKKELKKRVGTPTEEVPLEKLAGSIMAQLARRNIWIVDVQIFEYSKRQISFREANDGTGVLIKGKKFSLEKGAAVIAEELEEMSNEEAECGENEVTPQQVQALARRQILPQGPKLGGANLAPPPPVNPNRVLSYLVFEPDCHAHEAKKLGLRLTVGSKYPVHRTRFDEKKALTVYSITDDAKKVVDVDERFFVPLGRLVGDDEVEGGFSQPVSQNPRPTLLFENEMRTGGGTPVGRQPTVDDVYKMPELRPRR
jgi:hypothetical protein